MPLDKPIPRGYYFYMYKNSAREERAVSPGGILATVSVAQLMVSLDVSVVNVALPSMRTALGFDESGLSWVVNAYTLTFGGLLLLGGRAADRFGRRPLLLLGLALFGITSLLGGLAQDPGQLIAARAAQGVGAALIAPAALAVLTTSFPAGPQRGKALGVYSAVTAGGAAVGVVVGGLLTEYINWRWVMLVNVPMALVGAWLATRHVPAAGAGDTARRLDVVGAVLATLGTSLLVFALVRTDTEPWGSTTTIGSLIVAAVLLTGFFVYEGTYAKEPLLRLGVLTNRSVSASNLYMMMVSINIFTSFYFVSLYLQQVLGMGALSAGLAFLPFCLGLVVGSLYAVKLLARFPARQLLIVGGVIGAIGMFWFSRIRPDGTFLVDILGPSLVTSFGIGPLLVPIANAATAGVAPNEAGMASGLLNSARQLGGSIGLASMSAVAAAATAGAAASDSVRERLTSGYGMVFAANSALLVFAVLVAVFLLPRRSPGPVPGPAPRPGGGAGARSDVRAGEAAPADRGGRG
ncbi:putative transmembrane efflux protein [Streptomyces venezuelae ATCC 10712]|uniref:Putative transmembrane efflux protein n=3 Tax=Streptomyces TaxID=1883 RepID=F2R786_STRVP|nr:MFS transporter [Streptomyces venezuelae]CCA53778.1 putative transmembrane efflux protein [Streptomyces venezuelae ATCC 10712]